MNPKANVERDVKLGKKLSYLLRHGALKEKISIKPDGYVNLETLLHKHLMGYSLDDVKRVVTNDNKQRFALKDEDGLLEIKANQGHTIKEINQLILKTVEKPDFDIIHGSYKNLWPSIKKQGLSRMKRNHIHFAKGLNFVCGLRQSADLYIYVNFEKAKRAGLQFFESENGVILCAGNGQGILETKYFLKVVTREGRNLLPES